ncbi:NAD(P)/FAD-dependent oxidoreductase [Chengkuizengella axinellae]|uniref:NAD(P)/FAD-dependent oxidoreductase n=1 Tax=Chengkuizengella axinellae TaxID=3064388 RepID=A0ABT9J165_9BACL|nr:NAD(P)/FAD-dependent oxidoreductase [Chengkuizengella sp. 2205SS18-9]MDP5275162.1 NAD(P)/FAD-dependent oxidoreductase [Chengkuizengella sp. 2205SS18-9]
MLYDCIIIGGGIAGLQAAIQLGRYEHEVLVIDKGYGRSTLCRSYHNLLGWPNGISGQKLRELGKSHAESLNVEFIHGEVVQAIKKSEELHIHIKEDNQVYKAKTLLIATGILDRMPKMPELISCLGLSVYVCPDCDGYEVKNKRTVVLGAGDIGAKMALALKYWTNDLVYINHEQKQVSSHIKEKMEQEQIEYSSEPIEKVLEVKGMIYSVVLRNGDVKKCEKGFIAFGGNEVNSLIAKQLGVERLENKHIITDPRTKMTNIKNVWSAGDINVHSEQVSIAMGEGSQSAIWIHKTLLNNSK